MPIFVKVNDFSLSLLIYIGCRSLLPGCLISRCDWTFLNIDLGSVRINNRDHLHKRSDSYELIAIILVNFFIRRMISPFFAWWSLPCCLNHWWSSVNRVTYSFLTCRASHASSLLMVLQPLSSGASTFKLWKILLMRGRLKSTMIFIRESDLFRDIVSWSMHLSKIVWGPKSMSLQIDFIFSVKNACLLEFMLWLSILLDSGKGSVLFTWWDNISLILAYIYLKFLFRVKVFEDLESKFMIFNTRADRKNWMSVFVSHITSKCLLFDMNLVGTDNRLLFLNYNRTFRLLNWSMFSGFSSHSAILSMISIAVDLNWSLWLLLKQDETRRVGFHKAIEFAQSVSRLWPWFWPSLIFVHLKLSQLFHVNHYLKWMLLLLLLSILRRLSSLRIVTDTPWAVSIKINSLLLII